MGLEAVYCAAVFLVYLAGLIYNVLYVGDPTDLYHNLLTYRGFGGKLKYLTFWNLVLQTVYFGLCVLNNWCGSHVTPDQVRLVHRSSLQKLRDFLHTSVVFPAGAFVVVTFWAIYVVDRELVYPQSLDKIIPPAMNHIMHTTVLPFLLVEKMLVYHHHPRRIVGFLALSFFALGYLFWILWIAYVADIWVYPVLKVLDGGQRTIFIGVCLAFFFSLYLTGEALTKFFWRRQLSVVVRKSR